MNYNQDLVFLCTYLGLSYLLVCPSLGLLLSSCLSIFTSLTYTLSVSTGTLYSSIPTWRYMSVVGNPLSISHSVSILGQFQSSFIVVVISIQFSWQKAFARPKLPMAGYKPCASGVVSTYQSAQLPTSLLTYFCVFKKPHSHPNGFYWGHQCSSNSIQVSIMQSDNCNRK